ncbi:MAG: right-handed parallel beta-helix repeat-containing protein [Sphingomonadaceae bacterium]|nr:right-handed parallel beta-helix repeat-containing protein [Sphingomonadaceae bacterium]
MRLSPIILLLVAIAITAPLEAQQAGAPFTVQETGESFARLDEALASLEEGDGTIVIAPGTYRQCGRQQGGRVAFVAAEPGTAIFDGRACEGKAALVLNGDATRVEGLVFRNIAVEDGNGAGLRLQTGDLTVVDSMFADSQQGILTADDSAIDVTIEHSTFSGLGTCEDSSGCAHSIYIGRIGSLTVTASRFERGTGGHYVKSRAARVAITDSSFDDSHGRATNYLIDLPNGATGVIAGNTFVFGADKENRTGLIALAANDTSNSSVGLAITGNTASLAPGIAWRTSFLADWSGQAVRLADNEIGNGIDLQSRH